MDSRLIILLTFLVGIYAFEELEVSIEEKGEKFTEVVDFDFKRGLELIKVPKHGVQREAVEVMKDLRRDFSATKVLKDKRCYVKALDADEKNMYDFEEGLKLAKGRIPSNRIEKHKGIIVMGGDVPAAWMTEQLKVFCEGHQIVMVNSHDSHENLEKMALKLAIASKSSGRKRAVLREFVACDNGSTMTIAACDPTKLEAKCRIRTAWCTYVVSCPLDMGSGGFNCGSAHKLESMVCCDYACKA